MVSQLPRPQLQALAKKHGIRANQKSDALVRELYTVLQTDKANGGEGPHDLIQFKDVAPQDQQSYPDTGFSRSENDVANEVKMTSNDNTSMVEEKTNAVPGTVDECCMEKQDLDNKVVRQQEVDTRDATLELLSATNPKSTSHARQPISSPRASASRTSDSVNSKQTKKAAPLPRVATLTRPPPPPRTGPTRSNDRFAELYQVQSGPSATSYNTSVKHSAPSAMSFSSGQADRFAGHDSRYRKGLRKSTMPIHDPEVYRAKQPDENVPLPHVASLAAHCEKPVVVASNERFAGPDSIYNAPETPAPTAYNTTGDGGFGSRSMLITSFDKSSTERFTGQDSIYNASKTPAPTAYNTTGGDGIGSRSMLAPSFDKSSTERFTGPDSIYNASKTPAPTAYNTSGDGIGSRSMLAPSFDKSSTERFAGPNSIYNAAETPAPTAYNTASSAEQLESRSVLVPSFEKSTTERFSGHDSIYRKGLRQSTIPSQQCSDLAPRPTIHKAEGGWGPSSKRGAALKAALKISLLGAVVE